MPGEQAIRTRNKASRHRKAGAEVIHLWKPNRRKFVLWQEDTGGPLLPGSGATDDIAPEDLLASSPLPYWKNMVCLADSYWKAVEKSLPCAYLMYKDVFFAKRRMVVFPDAIQRGRRDWRWGTVKLFLRFHLRSIHAWTRNEGSWFARQVQEDLGRGAGCPRHGEFHFSIRQRSEQGSLPIRHNFDNPALPGEQESWEKRWCPTIHGGQQ